MLMPYELPLPVEMAARYCLVVLLALTIAPGLTAQTAAQQAAAAPALPAAAPPAAPPAADRLPFSVPRLSGPIQLDGRVDEPAWLAIEPLPVVSSSPVFGAVPSERTEFRIAHDDDHLYVSGRLFDSEPDGIRAVSLRRDEGSFGNDWFVINLDPYRDRENTLAFGTNPAGVLTDVAFSGDGVSSNFGWNTFWDARVSRDEDGWYAEMRIPLSSLRFEVHGDEVVMGVTIWRRIARRNEMISWPGIRHDWGTNSIFKASQMTEMALRGVQHSNPVYVTPYALAGAARAQRLDADGDRYRADDRTSVETGLDVKYSPTTNLSLDITLNTDFAQVEADDQQVNLTRFSLFFPERRLFFQERASLFDFVIGTDEKLFYSRRIGLVDGEPTRIYGGLRAVGRAGEWDVGLLDMQTAATATTRSENTGVVRVRRRLLNENSYLGGMVTSRIDTHGTHSLAGGIDAIVRVFGQDYMTVAVAATETDTITEPATDRLLLRATWGRRGIYGLTYGGGGAYVGRSFSPSLGFQSRRDHVRGLWRAQYGVRMPEQSALLRHSFGAEVSALRRNADHRVESGAAMTEWSAETRTGHVVTLTARGLYEDLTTAFRLAGDVIVPAGLYRFATGRLNFTGATTGLLIVNGNVEAGGYFDGRRASLSLSPTWSPLPQLQLSGTYQVNRIDFDTRDVGLTTHLLRLRSQVMTSSRLSGVALLQYNSTAHAALINLRVRYNPREGNDLYVVYNHGLNTDPLAYDPVRPRTDNSALILKYSHTVRL
jgi:hypothetical protein